MQRPPRESISRGGGFKAHDTTLRRLLLTIFGCESLSKTPISVLTIFLSIWKFKKRGGACKSPYHPNNKTIIANETTILFLTGSPSHVCYLGQAPLQKGGCSFQALFKDTLQRPRG